jgi:hypothetical protein
MSFEKSSRSAMDIKHNKLNDKSLLGALIRKYPSDSLVDFVKFCIKQKVVITDSTDFYEHYAKYLESSDRNINALSSTTWGICQEKLKRLSDEYSQYIGSRAGIWGYDQMNSTKIITFRHVCDFVDKFD